MAKDSKQKHQPTGDYGVGYCRPPQAGRFKKGQSGNSAGRPKGTKNMATYLDEILRQRISVREGGKVKKMSKAEAMLHNLYHKAMKGDSKALSSIIALARLSGLLDQVADNNNGASGVLLITESGLSREERLEEIAKQQEALQNLPKYVKYPGVLDHLVPTDGTADSAKRWPAK